MASSPCAWLGRDENGRPYCVHGPAFSNGPGKWGCREQAYRRRRKYRASDKGIEAARRESATDYAHSRKALYELTRIRAYRSDLAP